MHMMPCSDAKTWLAGVHIYNFSTHAAYLVAVRSDGAHVAGHNVRPTRHVPHQHWLLPPAGTYTYHECWYPKRMCKESPLVIDLRVNGPRFML